jgi:Ca2+-binding EF-hand superfamily protein
MGPHPISNEGPHMLPRFSHRFVVAILLFAVASLIVPAAFSQNSVMFNDNLLMDEGMLTMLDTDSSGTLSAEEYSFFRDRLFAQNDIGQHDAISAQEFADHAKQVFANMDADHDGFLTRDEINAAHMDMLREMYKSPHNPNLDALADAMMARMDTNHEGKISAQEYADAMKSRFDEMDTNHDGKVTRKEFNAVHHQHKG